MPILIPSFISKNQSLFNTFPLSDKKILILRFSAMGDVALLLPVVKSLVAAYPGLEVTVVTRPKFASFFTGIEGVVPFPADIDYTYNGVFGMRELFKKLMRRGHYDLVIDMHDHIRTMVMRSLFKLFGMKVIVFDKGRKEKNAFARPENKITQPLKHTVSRYQEVLHQAGYEFPLLPPPYFVLSDALEREVNEWLKNKRLIKNESWIGVAPFAAHLSKIWPVDNYTSLIRILLQRFPAKFFLFGGGEKEVEAINSIAANFPDHVVSVAGVLKIKQELVLMNKLDLMVCVDSSNMHLAALLNLPLLSIWGGTHPDVGFGPLFKTQESIIQISRDELPCRPCSVYGRETCLRKDFACLHQITPEMVADRLEVLLAK